ncbi:kinase-like domain-containing protein [Zopfochytrium polystomum]|nr:kinase-like domain-containing protein [Zopfochytrium polystomum]
MEVVGARDKTAALQSDELVFKNRLGGGVESDVFRCDWRDLPVAVKCYKIPAAEDAAPSHQANPFASFTIEAAMLMSLRHKNVIHLLGFGCDPPSRPFLVNELLARGSLFHVLAAAPASDLAPARKKSILLDAAAGMSFLHACRPTVVHLDLKSLNLLIADDWTCKVADFGIAATSTGTAGGGGAAHGGTIHWMPPELMIDDVPPASTKVDVFAFAVIMWEVAWRKKPWLGVDLGVICSEVLAGRRLEVGRSWPPEFARLVRDCWDQDPKRRPEFKECLRRLQRIEVP